jgi:hypothetical protein
MNYQPKPHHCKITYNPDTNQVKFTVTENANQPKPTTGDDRPSKRPSIEHGEDYLPDRPASGEWTVERINNSDLGILRCGMQEIERRVHLSTLHRVADAHNAALDAAVREAVLNDVGTEGSEYIVKLEKQLAAEKGKVQPLVDALKQMVDMEDVSARTLQGIARDALKKVGK